MTATLTNRLFPALAEASLRRYLSGQIASVLGSWTQNVTLNLLVYHLSGSAAILALLNFLLYGPQLIVAPVAGSRIRSENARRVTLCVLMTSLVLTASLFVLSFAGMLGVKLILAHALAIGISSAIEVPARQVLLLSSLRDASLTSNAVAMNTMVYNVGRMVGPTIAGFVYPAFGERMSFAIYMAALGFMAACVRSIRLSSDVPAKQASGLRDAVDYVMADAFSARYLPILACIGLFAGSYQTLVPLLADRAYHDAAYFTGLFFACAGAGSLSAAVLLSSALGPRASERFIAWSPWTAVAALLVLAVITNAVASGPAFYALGFSLTFAATSTNATIQRRCPEHVRGGLVGMYGMAYNGTMPFGYLLVGTASEALGVRNTFCAMAAVLGAGVLSITLLQTFRKQRSGA
ncbi:MFS transporter [Burkholderia gladioli]|uniref:MFS transporter n=1 Tax=Burkholderia gladioli TaxID=28095 RepID=UPI001641B11A|nr:MFS transporter [Burkholderia gladioli]MBJ9675834.1 MFS transporter [Burkholderia gladioli]MBU9321020.1 MFS transporter [Burkholderia gladioli]MBU9683237.1 MFS transporter [Burkholderia gladioli]MDN7464434.1 MFS transporter [Burkholderia gladioli]